MQKRAGSYRPPPLPAVVIAAALLAVLAGCAPPTAAPVQLASFAPAVVQTDFLLVANDRGVTCNFTVRELAGGSAYDRELHTLTVALGTGPRIGPGQIGVVLILTRADSSSVSNTWPLIWPIAMTSVHFGNVSYVEPDRWPGSPTPEIKRENVWTLPRRPEVARSAVDALSAGQVAISYATLGTSFYAPLGPTSQHGGSKPQAYDWKVPVMATAAD